MIIFICSDEVGREIEKAGDLGIEVFGGNLGVVDAKVLPELGAGSIV